MSLLSHIRMMRTVNNWLWQLRTGCWFASTELSVEQWWPQLWLSQGLSESVRNVVMNHASETSMYHSVFSYRKATGSIRDGTWEFRKQDRSFSTHVSGTADTFDYLILWDSLRVTLVWRILHSSFTRVCPSKGDFKVSRVNDCILFSSRGWLFHHRWNVHGGKKDVWSGWQPSVPTQVIELAKWAHSLVP